MLRMINPIREYAWGSQTAFSELFGWDAPQGPQAELWMGAPASDPSSVVLSEGGEESVVSLESLMGDGETFPFLLKVLAADRPLSLQAHPGRDHAEQGYCAENQAGIAMDSPLRNYQDPNPKPELIVAVTEFIALCGFRSVQGIAEDLQALSAVVRHWSGTETPSVAAVISHLCQCLGEGDYRAAAQYILRDAEGQVSLAATVVNEVVVESALAPAPSQGSGHKAPELPPGLADTLLRVSQAFPQDPSLFVVMLMNRVVLQPGEALYLPPGQLHAYLQGTGIEMMTNSDNVLRGGLTAKHIDLDELLKVASWQEFEDPYCPVAHVEPGRTVYEPPFGVLRLERIRLGGRGEEQVAGHLEIESPRHAIVLCLSGAVTVEDPCGGEELSLAAGQSLLLRDRSSRQLRLARPADGAEATVFIAAVADATAGEGTAGEGTAGEDPAGEGAVRGSGPAADAGRRVS